MHHRPPPQIPRDRTAEFDLVVDIAIRPRNAFDGRERSFTRLRVPLDTALDDSKQSYLMARVREELRAQIGDNVAFEGPLPQGGTT